jgi:hypothetical protein
MPAATTACGFCFRSRPATKTRTRGPRRSRSARSPAGATRQSVQCLLSTALRPPASSVFAAFRSAPTPEERGRGLAAGTSRDPRSPSIDAGHSSARHSRRRSVKHRRVSRTLTPLAQAKRQTPTRQSDLRLPKGALRRPRSLGRPDHDRQGRPQAQDKPARPVAVARGYALDAGRSTTREAPNKTEPRDDLDVFGRPESRSAAETTPRQTGEAGRTSALGTRWTQGAQRPAKHPTKQNRAPRRPRRLWKTRSRSALATMNPRQTGEAGRSSGWARVSRRTLYAAKRQTTKSREKKGLSPSSSSASPSGDTCRIHSGRA